MPLKAGTRLGPYEITAPIGAGGMGEVYRATDTKLRRDVAIKVLPDDFAQDRERLARFEREAHLLASLNHPNIAAIHGLQESDGVRCLVLELVEGETLADRIAGGALPIDEALGVAQQIASALEAAHEKGIIHRDLKPANVKIAADGTVKVLDFGLAKSLQSTSSVSQGSGLSRSPTVTREGTREGVILGTAPYMSPEQARGKALDKRTDIWSFGCVLYECLTGEQMFRGETATDILSAILRAEQEWSDLPDRTPPRVRELLQRCLERELKNRLHDIGDARLEIEKAVAGQEWTTSGFAVAITTPPAGPLHRWTVTVSAAAVLLAVGAAAGISFERARFNATPTPVVRFSTLTPETGVVRKNPLDPPFLVSSDGGAILFWVSGTADVGSDPVARAYVRRVDRFDLARFPELDGVHAASPSPDGLWIAFIESVSPGSTRKRLVKTLIDRSAPPVEIAVLPGDMGANVVWLPGEDIVVFSSGKPWSLLRFPADGGDPAPPVEIHASGFADYHLIPYASLPDGRHVLAWAESYGTRGWQLNVVLVNTRTGDATVLVQDAGMAVVSLTGHLLFTRGDTMNAVLFDLERLETTGGPVAIFDGIRTSELGTGGSFGLSVNGTLVYRPGGYVQASRRLSFVNKDGNVEPWSDDRHEFQHLAVSQDGQRLAATIYDPTDRLSQIWISDVAHSRLQPLVHGPREDCGYPVLSFDGGLVAYWCWATKDTPGLYIRQADGTRQPERLLVPESEDMYLIPSSLSPDGSMLLVNRESSGTEILLVPVESSPDTDRSPWVLMPDHSNSSWGRFSPDGRWITYQSDDTGRSEAYLREFRSNGTLGPPRIVSTGGGVSVAWPSDSGSATREVVFRDGDGLQAVSIIAESGLVVSKARRLLELDALPLLEEAGQLYFYPLPDGRWLTIQQGEEEAIFSRINVVLNFHEELKRRVPAQ